MTGIASDSFYHVQGCQPCKNVCSIFKAEKMYFGWKTVFSPIVQYTCVVINLQKNSIFLNPAVFLGIFIKTKSTKYCKKVTLGISACYITLFWLKVKCDIFLSCECDDSPKWCFSS